MDGRDESQESRVGRSAIGLCDLSAVSPAEALQPSEGKRRLLEASLSQLLVSGAQPVLVAAPVVGRDGPGHVHLATGPPAGAGDGGRQQAAVVALQQCQLAV